MERAYIELGDAVGEHEDDVPFMLEGSHAGNWQSREDNANNYWVIYGLTAHEGQEVSFGGPTGIMGNADPDAILSPIGEAVPPGGNPEYFVVYWEVLRDQNLLNDAVVNDLIAHEITHLFGADDVWDERGEYLEPEQDGVYTSLTLHTIRSRGKPGN